MTIPTLHPMQCQKILTYIRAGADPEVAALAVGATLSEFRKAIEYALTHHNPAQRGPDGIPLGCSTIRPEYASLQLFAWEVLQTWAQACLAADIRMYREKPADWLRSGPGGTYKVPNRLLKEVRKLGHFPMAPAEKREKQRKHSP